MSVGVLLAMAAVGPLCFAAARDLPADTALSSADLTPVACHAAAPRAPLRYDRGDETPVTSTAIAAGAYLGQVVPLTDDRVKKGDRLTLRSMAGPVTIERTVVAMQSGRSGGRVFVRDAEGKVFAAPLALELPR